MTLGRLRCFFWGHRWIHTAPKTWKCRWCGTHRHTRARPDRKTWWLWRWLRSRTFQVNAIVGVVELLNMLGTIELPQNVQVGIAFATVIANMILRGISSEPLPTPSWRRGGVGKGEPKWD